MLLSSWLSSQRSDGKRKVRARESLTECLASLLCREAAALRLWRPHCPVSDARFCKAHSDNLGRSKAPARTPHSVEMQETSRRVPRALSPDGQCVPRLGGPRVWFVLLGRQRPDISTPVSETVFDTPGIQQTSDGADRSRGTFAATTAFEENRWNGSRVLQDTRV